MVFDVTVIGAGVVGAMLSRELSKYKLRVCVVEKTNDVATGASRANSGIIHGGFDPVPGTLKAKMNTQGVALLYEAAKQLNVPYKNNGSLVCAFSEEELPALQILLARAKENQIPGVRLISGYEARVLEPQLSEEVTAAIYAPNAGIICPYELTIAAMGNAMDNGVELKRNFSVNAITREDGIITITAEDGSTVQSRYVVNCAGAYSDRIAAMAGDENFTIIPRAGEYLLLDKSEGVRAKHTLFQVPSKAGKGILVSPTVDGNLLLGPTAAVVENPQCRDTTADGLATVIRLAKRTMPTVDVRQVITSFSGVRSTEKHDDFIMQPSEKTRGVIHAVGIDSPGLTCCVAIARYLVDLLKEAGMQAQEKEGWNGHREDMHAFRHMDIERKNARIQQDPAYGKIVCRCETVSEGEIIAAIRNNPPAVDVDGVKRRTRSGMGRCQGGFCGPYIMQLLAKEQGVGLEQITKSGEGSNMVTERIGE